MDSPPLLRLTSLLALALAMHAAVPAEMSAQRDRIDQSTPVRRRCATARTPAVLPAADALLDSAAFVAGAARLAAGTRGSAIASLRYDPAGNQVRRKVIEASVPRVLADSLERLLFELRRTTAPADGEWGVRVGVELGSEVRLRMARRQVCPPQPNERELISTPSGFDVRAATAEQAGTALATDPSVVWVKMAVDERGTVIAATVTRGQRRGVWDERVLRYVRTLTFFPALEDGYPVVGEVEMPIRLALVR